MSHIIKRNHKLKYFATHEGFLFGFQKYHEENEISLHNSKLCQLHLEVLSVDDQSKFKQDAVKFYNHDIQRCPSFTRIFHFTQFTNFKKIHLEIYKIFRQYFKNWVQKVEKLEYFSSFDLNNNKDDNLIKEYELMRNDNYPPFSIVFGQNMSRELPYSNKYFHDFYKLDQNNETQFVLAVVFSPHIDVNSLRLNRCLEAPFRIEGKPQQE